MRLTAPVLPARVVAVSAPADWVTGPVVFSVTAPPVTEAPNDKPPATVSAMEVGSDTVPVTARFCSVLSEKPPVLLNPASVPTALPPAVNDVVPSEWPWTLPVMLPPVCVTAPTIGVPFTVRVTATRPTVAADTLPPSDSAPRVEIATEPARPVPTSEPPV